MEWFDFGRDELLSRKIEDLISKSSTGTTFRCNSRNRQLIFDSMRLLLIKTPIDKLHRGSILHRDIENESGIQSDLHQI